MGKFAKMLHVDLVGKSGVKDCKKDLNPDKEQPVQTDRFPVVPYRVLYSEIPFYSDPECTKEVSDARLVILEAMDPDDSCYEPDILAAKKRYQPEQTVTWELNNKQLWEEAWFRHPKSGQIERAWTLCVEFVGRVISQQALDQNREELEEIKRKLAERRSQAKSVN